MKKVFLSLLLCLFVGLTANAEITYNLGDGRVVLETNDDLWNLIKPCYNVYLFEHYPDVGPRADQTIANAGTFLNNNQYLYDFLNDANSGFKWLADYLLVVDPSLKDAAPAVYRWSFLQFLNKGTLTVPSYFNVADYTKAGEPSSWLPYYTEDVVIKLPKVVLGNGVVFTLPKLTQRNNTFLGWRDQFDLITTQVSGTSDVLTAQWQFTTTDPNPDPDPEPEPEPTLVTLLIELDGGELYLPNPTKEGYEFTGWYDNATCTGVPLSELTNGITAIYAGWEKTGLTTESAAVTAEDENAPRYNILGLRVDARYKGIVIQNGKKYLQQ